MTEEKDADSIGFASRISESDRLYLLKVLQQEVAAQTALNKATVAYHQAVGARKSFIDYLQSAYDLSTNDTVDADTGVISRRMV